MKETRFPIGSVITCVVMLALACFVIFGDRHVRNAAVVLVDGTLIKNAQVDSNPTYVSRKLEIPTHYGYPLNPSAQLSEMRLTFHWDRGAGPPSESGSSY